MASLHLRLQNRVSFRVSFWLLLTLVPAGEVWTSIPLINKAGDIVSGDLNGSIGKWDQFSANDIKATYDENVYTTKLELDKISSGKKAEARRLAAEIEGRLSKSVRKSMRVLSLNESINN